MRELTIEEMMMVSGGGSLDAKDGPNYGDPSNSGWGGRAGAAAGSVAGGTAGAAAGGAIGGRVGAALGGLAGWGIGNSVENSINNGGEPDWGSFTPMGDYGGGSSSIGRSGSGREKGGGDSGGRGH